MRKVSVREILLSLIYLWATSKTNFYYIAMGSNVFVILIFHSWGSGALFRKLVRGVFVFKLWVCMYMWVRAACDISEYMFRAEKDLSLVIICGWLLLGCKSICSHFSCGTPLMSAGEAEINTALQIYDNTVTSEPADHMILQELWGNGDVTWFK